MKYRALLVLPGANRETKPQQSLANSLQELEEWALSVLAATEWPHGQEQPHVIIEENITKPVRRLMRSDAIHELDRRALTEAARNQQPERRRISQAIEDGGAAQ